MRLILKMALALALLGPLAAPTVAAAEPWTNGYGETCVQPDPRLLVCEKIGTMYGYVAYDDGENHVFARHATDWEGGWGRVGDEEFDARAGASSVNVHGFGVDEDRSPPWELVPSGCVLLPGGYACLQPYLWPQARVGAAVDTRDVCSDPDCPFVAADPTVFVFESDSVGAGFTRLGWCLVEATAATCPGMIFD